MPLVSSKVQVKTTSHTCTEPGPREQLVILCPEKEGSSGPPEAAECVCVCVSVCVCVCVSVVSVQERRVLPTPPVQVCQTL